MKKKVLALILCAMMATTAVVGGTLAYFTDTEDEINVFTLGNVKIDLVEEQRDDNGTALEEFEDNKVLLPIVGSAQGGTENVGGYNLPTKEAAKNWVDKIVTVDNEGTQDAYVRVLFAFPDKMDDEQSAAEMMLHWNHDGSEPANTWKRMDAGTTVTLDGEVYNVYNYTYLPILNAKGEEGSTTASPAITGVYIDSRVNATVDANGAITYTMVNGRDETKNATYAEGTAPKLYVLTQGVQADGFADAEAALAAGFGDPAAANAENAALTNAQAWFNVVATGEREDITD